MNLDWAGARDVLQTLSYAVVLLGIPVGLYRYWKSARKEQLDREYGTYNALDDKYLEFVKLCLQRPYLDVFDIADTEPTSMTAAQKKEELIAYTFLFSIFERAYLMYRRQSSKLRRRQWSGWDRYIRDYAKRRNFREAFRISGSTFDTDFQEYMGEVLDAEATEPASAQ